MLSPNYFYVSARAIQSLRHVQNFLSGEKINCISLLAYRSESGLWYLSVVIIVLLHFLLSKSNICSTKLERTSSGASLEFQRYVFSGDFHGIVPGEACIAIAQFSDHLFQLPYFHISQRISAYHLTDLLCCVRMGNELII